MTFLKLILISFLLILSGCATSLIETPPNYIIDKTLTPSANTTDTRELGDTLVSAMCSRQTDSWRISEIGRGDDNEKFSLSSTATAFRFPSQVLKPVGTTSDGLRVFVATQGSIGFPPNREPVNESGGLYNSFCERQNTLHYGCDSLRSSSFVEMAATLKQDGWVERAAYIDYGYPSLQQELIYNGRIQNNLKFVYRELASESNGSAIMRRPFQQEVQYDLSESDVIGFKGARLKIIEATNRNVTYEVLEHFPISCAQ
jgi:hypothetical protein